jgi:8-oxo-dGTP diphosphatase
VDREIISRAVIVVDGRLLVARMRGRTWGFLPGGHVEHGETLLQGLHRELAEELGAAAEAAVPIGSVEHVYNDEHGDSHLEISHVFAVRLAPDQPVRALEDHLEFGWVAVNEVAAEVLRPEALRLAVLGWLSSGHPFQVVQA